MKLSILSAAVATIVCGCLPDVGSELENRPCGSGNTCLKGYACVNGVCVVDRDASTGDASSGDASHPDAATPDAGGTDGGPSDAGPKDGGAADASQPDAGVIEGSFLTRYQDDTGTQSTVPAAPYQTTVGAWVPSAAASSYDHAIGTLRTDGTFTIPTSPAGSYFLEVIGSDGIPVLTEIKTHTPVSTTFLAQRPDLAYPSVATPVTVTATNLDPYSSWQALEISSSQADISLDAFNASTPAAGATSFSVDIDWNNPPPVYWSNAAAGLPDAARGDSVYVAQAAVTTLGTGSTQIDLRRVTKAVKLTDLTLVDGQAGLLTAHLAAAAQTGSLAADVRYTDFAALTSDVHPAAVFDPSSFEIAVRAAPYSLAPITRWGPLLADFFLSSGAVAAGPASDHDYGALAYGRHLDAVWKEFRSVEAYYSVSFTAPGATTPADAWSYVFSYVPMAPAPTGPIAPVLGPPKSPLINGLSAFTARTNVGLQPTLSWSPPARGTANRYWILVESLEKDSSGNTVMNAVFEATIFSGLSFKVPPGLLSKGSTYFAWIAAYQSARELDADVGLDGYPLYRAETITSTFAP